MKWFLLAFKKYAQFSGRSRRKEFWFFQLFVIFILIITTTLDFSIGALNLKTGMGPISTTCSLILTIPSLAVGIRRMHDVGKNGSFYIVLTVVAILINFLNYIAYEQITISMFIYPIFIISGIICLIYLFKDSQEGENEYGPNPKLDDLDAQFEQ